MKLQLRISSAVMIAAALSLYQLLQLPYVFSDQRYNGPEGVYWQVLRQMSAGRTLYAEIYYPQFPLFIELAHLGRFLPFQDLQSARFLFSLFAPLAITGFYLLARRRLSPEQSAWAAALLGASALFFNLSHQLTGEVPALALVIWALLFWEWSHKSRHRLPLLFASAGLFFLAVQIKPVTFLVLLLACAYHLRQRRLAEVSICFAVAAAFTGAALWFWGWFSGNGASMLQGGLWGDFLEKPRPQSWRENLEAIVTTRDYSRAWVRVELPCFLTAVALLWWRGQRKREAQALLWPAVLLSAALFSYICINPDHVVLFAPLTALAIAQLEGRTRTALAAALVAGSVFFTYIEYSGFPRANKSTRKAIQALEFQTAQGTTVMGNVPFVITAAGRLTPPEFTDLSPARIESGSVTCAQVVERFQRGDVGAFVYRTKGLENMKCEKESFRDVVKRYFPVSIYEDKRIELFKK